ncbi:MAG: hypothetical protein Phog2KO_22420 [Phototrophicaceae bacterium]
MRQLTISLLCACIFMLSWHTVQAQDLDFNISIENDLADGASASYSFIAREGQMLSFIASSEDTLDALLRIEDLNGDILLSADDYNYPDTRDAIIEGFIAPYSGSYTLIVESYAGTNGTYNLTMLSGYSTLISSDSFDSDSDWDVIGIDEENSPDLNIVNGTANLVQTGIDQIGLAVGMMPDNDIYFIRTRIDSIQDNSGWRTGLVFGYQDSQNYSRVLVNYRGAWRLVSVQNGAEVVLRDWNLHPAITPATTTFTLSVLVNGTYFDIFYNDQYIGSGNNPDFEQGQIGFVAETVSALGSEVTVRFDDLSITSPGYVNNLPIFPDNIIASGINNSIRELEQRLLIPVGGEMAFTLSDSFAQSSQEGVNRFPIGSGRTTTNFALGARISWTISNANLNACGFTIRDNEAEDYTLAYVDSDGGYGISERSGAAFIQNAFNIRTDNSSPPYDVILIVNDEQIHYFINGELAISTTVGMRDASIAEAVINFEAVNTSCQFDNLWVWQWD